MKSPLIQQTKTWAFLFWLAFAFNEAPAQFVDLTAEVELYDSGYKAAQPLNVRCVVGTNTWLMEGDFGTNFRETWWFTGTNLVSNTVITKQLSDDVIPRSNSSFDFHTPRVGEQYARVYDSTDGNPGKPVRQPDRLTGPRARICWLGFCSGPFLKRPDRQIFPPNSLWKELINAPSGFSDQVTVFDDSMGLPKSLNLSTSKGQPVFQYRVTASTNILGWDFPLEFWAAQYRPVYCLKPIATPPTGGSWILLPGGESSR